MDSIFFEYLEGADREEYIESASLDNEFYRLSTLFEMTKLKHQQSIRDAEFKVLVESGTYEDLEFLLEAENAENGEQKKSIFAKMLDVIKGILSSIKNAVTNFFSKGVPEKEVEVESSVLEEHKILGNIKAHWNAIESNFKAGRYDEAKKEAGKIVLTAAAVAGGGVAAVAAVKKVKSSELATMVKDAQTFSDKVNVLVNFSQGILGKLASNASGSIKAVFDKIHSIGSWIKSHITKIMSAITSNKGESNADEQNPQDTNNGAAKNNKLNKKNKKNKGSRMERIEDDDKFANSDNADDSNNTTPSSNNTALSRKNSKRLKKGKQSIVKNDMLNESALELSTAESIFGMTIEESAKIMEEKQDEFDAELADLRDMFEDL